jgi:hypothetical protein
LETLVVQNAVDHSQVSEGTIDVPFLQVPFADQHLSPTPAQFERGALMDLELMHHYTSYVCCDDPRLAISTRHWKHSHLLQEAPRLAVRYPFLMHNILAISAFHMVYITDCALPSEYISRATHHLDNALLGLRDALSHEITPELCVPLFLASSLLLSNTYASRRHVSDSAAAANPIDEIVSIVGLYHGTTAISRTASETFARNIFEETLSTGMPPSAGESPWLADFIRELQTIDAVFERAGNELSPQAVDVARRGVQTLLEVAQPPAPSEPDLMSSMDVRILYRWPFVVQQSYLDALSAREPAAIAVFVFYCAVMRQAEMKLWPLVGWAERLSEAAANVLADTPLLSLPQWAFNVVQQPYLEPESMSTSPSQNDDSSKI